MMATATKTSSAQLRKIKKPLIERRRRERINECLNQLKTLVLEASNKDESRYSKMEKADILEMTVSHLKTMHRRSFHQQQQQQPVHDNDRYVAGFKQCATEVGRYFAASSETTLAVAESEYVTLMTSSQRSSGRQHEKLVLGTRLMRHLSSLLMLSSCARQQQPEAADCSTSMADSVDDDCRLSASSSPDRQAMGMITDGVRKMDEFKSVLSFEKNMSVELIDTTSNIRKCDSETGGCVDPVRISECGLRVLDSLAVTRAPNAATGQSVNTTDILVIQTPVTSVVDRTSLPVLQFPSKNCISDEVPKQRRFSALVDNCTSSATHFEPRVSSICASETCAKTEPLIKSEDVAFSWEELSLRSCNLKDDQFDVVWRPW